MNHDLVLMGVQQGLLLALVAYGVMIPFRLLKFPDLSCDGAYPLGGTVCAKLMFMGLNPILATFAAILSSGLFCMGTSFLNLKFKLNSLLAGILLSTMIYSVNLRVLEKPNIGLFGIETLFSNQNTIQNILIILSILVLLIIPFSLLMKTKVGLQVRAVGLNPAFAKRRGISIARYQTLTLCLAGCFIGLSASLMVQLQNYMDIGMGIGMVIHGLAALMIGESIMGTQSLNRLLLAPLVGALVYQQIQGIVLHMGLSPSDIKLFTGMIVLLLIASRKNNTGSAF